MRRLILVVGVVSLCAPLIAQEDKDKPFVDYQGDAAAYLRRLHDKQGRLAWRDDYPGGFSAWQTAGRAKLHQLLGLNQIAADAKGHQPTVRLEKPIAEDGYTRQLGRLETEPGVTIPFWLLTPSSETNEARPLVICAHGHDSSGWNTYAGVYKDEAHRQATLTKDGDPGIQAVRRGYVALVPATRGLANVASIPDPKGRHGNRPCRAQLIHCLLAGRTAVGERVWDTQRLIDWALGELPGIDKSKLVLLGNSGGGVLTVHTAALDERIAVAVPSCSFSSFTSSTGFVFHCDCCLVPRAQVELGDMADIGALTAPRALLAVHGQKDGLHHYPDVEAAMSKVQAVYKAAGAPERFHHAWGTGGHKFYPEIMWPFIEKQLHAPRN